MWSLLGLRRVEERIPRFFWSVLAQDTRPGLRKQGPVGQPSPSRAPGTSRSALPATTPPSTVTRVLVYSKTRAWAFR